MIISNELDMKNGLVIINFTDTVPTYDELEKYFTIPFILYSQEIKGNQMILKLFFCGYDKNKLQKDNKKD